LTRTQTNNVCQVEDQQSWASITELYYRYDGEFAESDDGDAKAQKENVALRRAASLEVLKAYGGAFASGFLALQDPLPTRPKSKLRSYQSAEGFAIERSSSYTTTDTASRSSSSGLSNLSNLSRLSSPRPDSATLGFADDVRKGGKWSWKGLRKSRKQTVKNLDM
jgi:hypothetical protein